MVIIRLLTILAAEPLDGAEEAEMELRRPAEARVLGADVGAHRRRRRRLPAAAAPAAAFIQLHRAAIAGAPVVAVRHVVAGSRRRR